MQCHVPSASPASSHVKRSHPIFTALVIQLKLSCFMILMATVFKKKHAPKQELITEFYNLVPFLQLNFWNTSTSVPLLPSFAKQLGEVATATHEMIVEIGGPARVEGVPRKKWHAQFIELLMASKKTVFSSTLTRERS